MRLALPHLHDYTSYFASGLLIYLDRDFSFHKRLFLLMFFIIAILLSVCNFVFTLW